MSTTEQTPDTCCPKWKEEDCAAHKARASVLKGMGDQALAAEWAARHDIKLSGADLLAAFDDARSLRADSPAVSAQVMGESELMAFVDTHEIEFCDERGVVYGMRSKKLRELFAGKMLVSAGNKEAEHG
jgi:hypothetical protein